MTDFFFQQLWTCRKKIFALIILTKKQTEDQIDAFYYEKHFCVKSTIQATHIIPRNSC